MIHRLSPSGHRPPRPRINIKIAAAIGAQRGIPTAAATGALDTTRWSMVGVEEALKFRITRRGDVAPEDHVAQNRAAGAALAIVGHRAAKVVGVVADEGDVAQGRATDAKVPIVEDRAGVVGVSPSKVTLLMTAAVARGRSLNIAPPATALLPLKVTLLRDGLLLPSELPSS